MLIYSGSTRDISNVHSVVSRKLNKNTVVLDSKPKKKLRPKLAKLTPGGSDYVPVANSGVPTGKSDIDTNQDSVLAATWSPQPPLALSCLVQNKKMKASILEDY